MIFRPEIFRPAIGAFTLSLLAGCTPDAAPPVETPTSTSPQATAAAAELTPVTTLAGEWRVAGIDGEAWDEPYGLALSADEREIWWDPRCLGAVRSYTIDGLALSLGGQLDTPPLGPDGAPPPVCAIAPPPGLMQVMVALDAADTIGRDPSNAVVLSGGGHSLTLYSQ